MVHEYIKRNDEYIERNDNYVDGLAFLATNQARAIARAQECFEEGNEDEDDLDSYHHSSTMHTGEEEEEEETNLLRAISNDKFEHAQEWLNNVQGGSSSLHDYASARSSAEHTVADGPLLEPSAETDDDLPDDTTEHDLEAFGIQVPEEWLSDDGVN